MHKPYIVALLFICLPIFTLSAQVKVPGLPESFSIRTKQAVIFPGKTLEALDTAALIEEDKKMSIINRYSQVQELNIDIKEQGAKTEISGKGYIWRYQITSENANSLGLTFSSFMLPEGSSLFIYNSDHTELLGAYTSQNNKDSHVLTIEDLNDKNAIIEYFEPYDAAFGGALVLGSVSQAYKELSATATSTARIGINCPEGDAWQDDKHAVARMTYVDGRYGYYCTGFLVNNVSDDGTPYFMTANHCISNSSAASTLVTYFNYENSTCSVSDAKETQTLSGATLKATNSASDFTLLLLDETPPKEYKAFLAGWDAKTTTPKMGVGIHHPQGTPKCISIDDDALTSYAGRISWDNGVVTAANTHWSVKFDYGNTESGSSGSPVFDENHRVIGQLHGGDDTESFYGKLSVSWNNSTSASAQLKTWLDPANSGTTAIDGTYLSSKPISAFASSYTQSCVNELISLSDKSKNSPKSWLWKIEPSTFSFVNGTGNTSKNPQLRFNQGGNYTVSLITSNEYGTDTAIVKDFIAVAENINVSFEGIPSDSIFCGYNLGSNLILAKGAHNYSFEIDNAAKLNLISNADSVTLSVQESAIKEGSFYATLKVNGYTGSCADNDSVRIKVAMPSNDYLENAIRLWPGVNQGYSNFCASSETNEPIPQLSSCTSDLSWCPSTMNNKINSSVWFTFVGPSNGRVTIDTQSADDRIAVYKAESFDDIISGKSTSYSIVAANDDRSSTESSSLLENISVDPGKTYWLQVDSKVGSSGDISINLLSNSLEIFPNPNDGKFDIIISTLEDGKAEVKLYNNLGKLMFTTEVYTSSTDNRFSFDCSNYPSGVYYMNVRAGNETMKRKLVIVKR
jgi:PKD repeat protein